MRLCNGKFSQPFPAYVKGDYKVYAISDNSEVVNLTGAYVIY